MLKNSSFRRPAVSKREMLARLLYSTGVFGAYSSHPSTLTVIGLHRIGPDRGPLTPLEEDCISLRQSAFRDQLLWLKRHASVIDESQLIAHCKEGQPLPHRAVMITFDDGYKDNLTLALPVLKELNLPATFFVPTDLIDQRRLGWWDHIAYAVKQTAREFIVVEDTTFKLSNPALKRLSISTLQQRMKLEPAVNTEGLVERVYEACEVRPLDAGVQDDALMTWHDLRLMAKAGMTIGSHTCSHRVLATLTEREQVLEITQSKSVLEEKLQAPVRSLAYPVGARQHFNDFSRHCAATAGYEVAYSFETGQNIGAIADRFAIKRIPETKSRAMIAGAISMPQVFGGRFG